MSCILVAYASRAGSTAEVAETIGQVLRERGAVVDVRPVKDVHDIGGYQAVVLGSAVWAGRPLPEAVKFATVQQRALADLPVAYFILCERLQNNTPDNREIVRGYVEPLRQLKEPLSVGLFAGKRDLSQTNPVVRWLLQKLFKITEGDWREWELIRAWAADLVPRLAVGEVLVHA